MAKTTRESAAFLFAALAAWEDQGMEINVAREAARAKLGDYEAYRADGGPEPMVTTGGYIHWPGDRMAADIRAKLDREDD